MSFRTILNLRCLILAGLTTFYSLGGASSQQGPSLNAAAIEIQTTSHVADATIGESISECAWQKREARFDRTRQSFVVNPSGLIDCRERTANFFPYPPRTPAGDQTDTRPSARSSPATARTRRSYCR